MGELSGLWCWVSVDVCWRVGPFVFLPSFSAGRVRQQLPKCFSSDLHQLSSSKGEWVLEAGTSRFSLLSMVHSQITSCDSYFLRIRGSL